LRGKEKSQSYTKVGKRKGDTERKERKRGHMHIPITEEKNQQRREERRKKRKRGNDVSVG
jgi:hypothetical protein